MNLKSELVSNSEDSPYGKVLSRVSSNCELLEFEFELVFKLVGWFEFINGLVFVLVPNRSVLKGLFIFVSPVGPDCVLLLLLVLLNKEKLL